MWIDSLIGRRVCSQGLHEWVLVRSLGVSQLQAGEEQQWKENLNHQLRVISSTSLRSLKSVSIVYNLA